MKKHIPNAITCCNLISGCIATTYALMGGLREALLWIVVGALFDFCDGMSARLLRVSSPIGKELDSLADVITFGFAPSAMLCSVLCWAIDPAVVGQPLSRVIEAAAFVMAAFSALRLAKFNLDERQSMGFIGLPTPANALFWGSLLVGSGHWIASQPWALALLLPLMLLSCWLLVAEVPMFALKFKHWGWHGNEVRYLFLLSCLPLLALLRVTGLAVIVAWYIVLSIVVYKRGVRV